MMCTVKWNVHTFGRVSANGQWIVLDPITATRYKSCIQEKAGPMIWPSFFLSHVPRNFEKIILCGSYGTGFYVNVWLYKYSPGRSWNMFRWTAKRVIFFPKCAALRENIVPRENISILAPPTRDISTVQVDICYIRWSKWMISSKYFVLYYDYHKVW